MVVVVGIDGWTDICSGSLYSFLSSYHPSLVIIIVHSLVVFACGQLNLTERYHLPVRSSVRILGCCSSLHLGPRPYFSS